MKLTLHIGNFNRIIAWIWLGLGQGTRRISNNNGLEIDKGKLTSWVRINNYENNEESL